MTVEMDDDTTRNAGTDRAAHHLLRFLHETTDAVWSVSPYPVGSTFPLASSTGSNHGFLCMSTTADDHRYQSIGEAVAMSLVLIAEAEAKMPKVPAATPDSLAGLANDFNDSRIVAYFQPIVALRTGEVVAIEALARMQTPDGVLGPESFLGSFDTPAAMWTLFDRMLESSLQFLSEHRHRLPNLSVAINLELAGIPQHGMADLVSRRLAEYAIDPDQVSIELNNRVPCRITPHALSQLRDVVALGASLLIDDVHSGFDTVLQLPGVEISGAKLDRRVVQSLSSNDPHGTEVATILARAAKSGIEVIAEGVETQVQYDKLIQLGCSFGQGYFFAVPQPASSLAAVLDAPLVGTW